MPFDNVPATLRNVVDLRSDTVTRPTPEMFEAMRNAPLGDDVLGDDPTVIELQELAAAKMGKEAALFVPSATMGNQIAIAMHTRPGDAILIEQDAHMLLYEVGAPAVIAGVVTWSLPSNKGVMDPAVIRSRIQKQDLHTPGTTLLCVENTHNRAGGTIVPLATMATYADIAKEEGMKIHLDGARIFNAAAGLGVAPTEWTKHADSVGFCLSKGLRSPVGSLLCGDKDFIAGAKFWRKRLGGGMRQAGILAACGIVSLTTMVDRLAEDHRRARSTAEAISDLPGISVDWDTVQTNMVFVHTETRATEWAGWLKDQGVLVLAPGSHEIRLVFHADIDDGQADRAVRAFKAICAKGA
jgi:threonine aldolase